MNINRYLLICNVLKKECTKFSNMHCIARLLEIRYLLSNQWPIIINAMLSVKRINVSLKFNDDFLVWLRSCHQAWGSIEVKNISFKLFK